MTPRRHPPRPGPLPARRAHRAAAPTPSDLLDHLGAGGAAWLDGARGFVTAGVAAIVEPADAVATLRAIDARARSETLGEPTPIGPRAVGALPSPAAAG